MLGVAGAAAACSAGRLGRREQVRATTPAPDRRLAPEGTAGQAGRAGRRRRRHHRADLGQGERQGVRQDRLPVGQAAAASPQQALLQRPTILSLDQDLHWARRLTYGISAPALRELKAMGRDAYLDKQLSVRPDPVVDAVSDRYPLLR